MRLLPLIFCLSLFTKSSAQAPLEPVLICNILNDIEPDWKDWSTYLQNNLQLDSAFTDTIPPGTYRAIINFEIGKDGTIAKASILMDPGHGLGLKALMVVKNYKRKIADPSNSVRYRRQPITFIIEEEECFIPSAESI